MGMERDLQMLDLVAERQFLAIGDRLQDFHDRAWHVSHPSGEGSELLTERGGDAVFGELQELLEGMADEVQGTVVEAQNSTQSLARLRVQLGALEHPLNGLAKTVNILTAHTFSTREEGAQTKADNHLEGLADDLKTLGSKVREKIEGVRAKMESMLRLSDQAGAKVPSVQGFIQVEGSIFWGRHKPW